MKIRSYYNSMHIHQKVVLQFLLLIFIVYAVGIGIGVKVQQKSREEEKTKVESMVQYLTKITDNDFRNLNKQQQQLVNDYNTQRLSNIKSLSDMGSIVDIVNRVQVRILVLRNSSLYVDKVSLCMIPLDRSISSEPVYEELSQEDTSVLEEYYGKQNSEKVIINSKGLYVIQPLNKRNLIFPTKTTRSSSYYRISKLAIQRSLNEAITNDRLSLFLLYKGKIILGAGKDNEKSAYRKAVLSKASDDISNMVAQSGEKFFVVRKPVPTLELELAACIPDEVLVMRSREYNMWLVLLTAVAVICFIMFIRFSNHLLKKPISRFVNAFQEVEHNNLDIVISHDSNDEFAYLYSGFNDMIQKIKSSMQQAYQEKAAAQRAELKQLQSQINPHFLYNSFFHIYRLSNMGDNEGASELSKTLGIYYQYITRNSSDLVQFISEYEHARSYTNIQEIRFGRRIRVEFGDMPEECREVMVPKLILQPVIENAYEHGLKDVEYDGRIIVCIENLDNYIKVIVEDNGKGIPEDRLAALSKNLQEPEANMEITGIINVSKRLRMRQGITSMNIETVQPCGIRFILTLNKYKGEM